VYHCWKLPMPIPNQYSMQYQLERPDQKARLPQWLCPVNLAQKLSTF